MPLTNRGGWPYANPPNTQFTLNRQSPQAKGLVAWWPFASMSLRDLAGVEDTAPSAGATIAPTRNGLSLQLDEDGKSVYGVASSRLKIQPPITLHLAGMFTGVPDQYSNVIGVSAHDDGSAPYACYAIFCGTTTLDFGTNKSGTWKDKGEICPMPSAGVPFALTFVISPSGGKAYLNGVAQAPDPGVENTIAFYADSEVSIGAKEVDRNLNLQVQDSRIYNRALSPAEIWAMYDPATRWELYAPVMPRGVVYVPAAAAGIPWVWRQYRQRRV